MYKVISAAIGALLLAPLASFAARTILSAVEIVEINAKPAAVWTTLSTFDGPINKAFVGNLKTISEK